jgi:membrane associated rhomboid family serine protease
MGASSRDYMRDRPLPGAWPRTPLTITLLVALTGAWFALAVAAGAAPARGLHRFAMTTLCLWPDDVLAGESPWQLLTSWWIVDPRRVGPLVVDVALLAFVGRGLERRAGSARTAGSYAAGGVAWALAFTGIANLAHATPPLSGPTGAIYGVAAALALAAPLERVPLLGKERPLPVAVLLALLVREVAGLLLGEPPGAPIARLGGGVGGAVAFLLLGTVAGRAPRRAAAPAAPAGGPPDDVAARVDALLARIHAEGIDALTSAEKEFLREASRRYGSRP